MSLEGRKEIGWLREHETSSTEISGIMALVERDLSDAAREEISTDWRFNIAYNAALQLATAVLYASGYRAGKGESKHYRTIQTLPLIMGPEFVPVKDYLDIAAGREMSVNMIRRGPYPRKKRMNC
jgi:hypothetical protein